MASSLFQKWSTYAEPLLEPLLMRFDHAFPCLENLYHRLLGAVRNLQVYVIKGTVKNTNRPATTIYVGSEESAYQFAYMAYSKIERMHLLGNVPCSQIDPALLLNADVVAVGTTRLLASGFEKQGHLLLPMVCFTLCLREPLDAIIRRSSGRRRRDVRKLANFNYTYTVSKNNEKDFDFFYWKMYLPYTKKRYQKAAHLKTYLKSKALYRKNGGILFVKNKARSITGILFHVREKTLYALSLGIYEGDPSLIRNLAGQAALFFLIQWAKTKGMEYLNYGATIPFFKDGVFVYKKEWGMIMEERPSKCLCTLKINSLNDGSLSFLQHNPFIFLDKGMMKGLILVDHKVTKAELQRIISEYSLPRLHSIIVIAYYAPDLQNTNANESSPISEKLPTALAKPLSEIYLSLKNQGFNVEISVFSPRGMQSYDSPYPTSGESLQKMEAKAVIQAR